MTPALAFLRENWALLVIFTLSTAVLFDGLVLLFFAAAKRLRHGPTHQHPSRDSGRGGDHQNHIGGVNP